MRSGKSTAHRLGEFREELRKYYHRLRKDLNAASTKPSPEIFTGYARQLAKQIDDEELRSHNQTLTKCNKAN